MCTVTYLPGENNSFILTSNRDEKPERLIAFPQVYLVNNQKLIYPRDHKAGGSWIAMSEAGKTACLLNGAFEKHQPKSSYRKSRGLVLLDLFSFSSADEFSKKYDFNDIEPFTLIVPEDKFVVELRWNGKEIFVKRLASDQAYIWSSVTLYSEDIIKSRKKWFLKFMQIPGSIGLEEVRNFHHFAGDGDEKNNLIMKRGNSLHTLSVTSIVQKEGIIQMIYEDLLTGKKYEPAFTSSVNEKQMI